MKLIWHKHNTPSLVQIDINRMQRKGSQVIRNVVSYRCLSSKIIKFLCSFVVYVCVYESKIETAKIKL